MISSISSTAAQDVIPWGASWVSHQNSRLQPKMCYLGVPRGFPIRTLCYSPRCVSLGCLVGFQSELSATAQDVFPWGASWVSNQNSPLQPKMCFLGVPCGFPIRTLRYSPRCVFLGCLVGFQSELSAIAQDVFPWGASWVSHQNSRLQPKMRFLGVPRGFPIRTLSCSPRYWQQDLAQW